MCGVWILTYNTIRPFSDPVELLKLFDTPAAPELQHTGGGGEVDMVMVLHPFTSTHSAPPTHPYPPTSTHPPPPMYKLLAHVSTTRLTGPLYYT